MEPCFSSLQQGERSSSWGCSMRVQGKEGSASGAAPGLDMFVSKDFIGTKHPPASLSLFTNKEWSGTKPHGLLISHPQILRKMSQISGEPGVGGWMGTQCCWHCCLGEGRREIVNAGQPSATQHNTTQHCCGGA